MALAPAQHVDHGPSDTLDVMPAQPNILVIMTDEERYPPSYETYFMTEDEVSEGLDQTTVLGLSHESVKEPAKVEAVLARLDAGDGPRPWKYARAYRRSLVGDPLHPKLR